MEGRFFKDKLSVLGDVGIGATNPASLLHIYSSAPVFTVQDGGAWGTNATAYVDLKDGSSSMAYVGVTGTDGHLDIKQLKAGNLRLYTNNTERVSILSNGTVGIGTTAPKSILEIAANNPVINFKDTSAGTDLSYRYIQNVDGKMLFAKANDAYNSFTTHMAIATDGNVGIGTTNPDGNLEVIASTVVSGASDTVNNVLIGLQTTNRPTIILDTADTTYTNRTWNITNVGSQGSLYIGRNGLDSLILKNDGKVGIGTASPSAGLHVINSTEPTVLFESTNAGSSGSRLQLYHNSATPADNDIISNIQMAGEDSSGAKRYAALIQTRAADVNASSVDGDIRFLTYKSDTPSEVMRITHDKTVLIEDGLVGAPALSFINDTNTGMWRPGSDQLRLATGGTDAIIIDSSQNVTIGNGGNGGGATITPGGQTSVYALRVDRSGSSGTSVDIWDYNSNSVIIGATNSEQTLAIKAGGNVGIGTTGPEGKLHIYTGNSGGSVNSSADELVIEAASSGGIQFLNGSTASGYILFGDSGGNSTGQIRYLHSDDSMRLTTANVERLIIDSSGNVGIGTTNPSTDFSVKEHLLFNDTTRLLTISNNTNTGGINLDGGNSRLYFSGYRALEGSNSGTTLTVGEGYGTTKISSVLNVVDHETILSPDQDSSGGVASRALTIENINDSNWTANALTAYNSTTGYDIRDRASYSFFARPTSGNILTFASETANQGTLHRFVNLNSSAAEPLYRWDFYQYDGSGTGNDNFKVPDKLFQIRVREGASEVEKFTIQGNGNVGIGTPTPDVKLEVIASPADGIIADFVNGTNTGGTTAAIKLSNADSEACDVVLGANRVNANFGSDFFISLSDNVDGTNQERFRITEAGNVGIGTTSPTGGKLQVAGKVRIDAGSGNDALNLNAYDLLKWDGANLIHFGGYKSSQWQELHFYTNGADALTIDASQNVGIGTTGPVAPLHVQSSENNIARFSGVGTAGTYIKLDESGTQAWVMGIDNGDTTLKIRKNDYNGDVSASFTSAGNVGIGTITPVEKLDINGNLNIDTGTGFSRYLFLEFDQTADETWVKVTLPQNSNSTNNGGSVKVRVNWLGKHATFGASQEYLITYTSNHGNSGYPYFSDIHTISKTFRSASYSSYSPSSTPDVIFYTVGSAEDALYFKVKGYHSSYNKKRQVSVEINGRTVTSPVLSHYGNTSPTSPSSISKAIEFNTAGHSYFNGGNVGIGTASPECKLDIHDHTSATTFIADNNAGVRITNWGGSTGWSLLGFGGSSSTYSRNLSQIGSLSASSGTYLAFGTSNNYGTGITNQAMTIDPSGNVGIGTVSPAQKLHVAGSTLISNNNYHHGYTTAGAQTTLIGIKSNNYVTVGQNNANHIGTNIFGGTGIIDFSTGGSTRMTLTTGGNVGIGTATPLGKLDILRLSSAEPGLIARANRDGAKMNFAYTNSNSMGEIGTTYNNSTGAMRLWIGGNLNSNSTGHVGPTQQGTSSSSWFSEYNTNNDYYQINRIAAGGGTSSSTLFYITSTGNVGIGGVTPTLGKLQVAGRGYFGPVGTGDATTKALMDTYSVLKLKPHDSNSTNMTFAQVNSGAGIGIQVTNGTQTANWDIALNPYGGNVGIGTASPATRLQVKDSVDNTYESGFSVVRSADGATTWINLRGGATNFNNRNNAGNAGLKYRWFQNSSEKMTLDTNGNLGIGTISPATKLDIVGTFKITDWAHFSNTGENQIVLSSSGSNFGFIMNPSAGVWSLGYGSDRDALGTSVLSWNSSNNVGIGTSNPSAKLHVVGSTSGDSVLKVDGTNGTLFEVVDDLSDSLMSVNDAAGLPVFEVFADNHIVAGRYNQNDFYLNTSGNLGLGTSSPITKLNIKGDQSANGQLYIEPTNDGEYAGLVIKTTRGADRAYAIFAGGTGTDDLNFRFRDASAGADRMVIDSSGNVGIGAPSPSAKLHVKEASSGLSSFDGTADTLILESNANGGMTIVTAAANTGRIIFASPNDATGAEIKYSDATDLMTIGTTNPDADLALQAGNGVEAVRILDDGKVGIGTTSPTRTLHIVGAVQLDGTIDTNSGAYLTSGGVWTDASSRELKKDIINLSLIKASEAVKLLNPVEFSYKATPEERRVGFIAEDVPDLVASEGRKGLSSMQIVAALTKVVQNQQKEIEWCKEQIEKLTKIK
jgi:hypothetical protein